eukprot:2410836-Prymnesium_polylepis.1
MPRRPRRPCDYQTRRAPRVHGYSSTAAPPREWRCPQPRTCCCSGRAAQAGSVTQGAARVPRCSQRAPRSAYIECL